MSIVAKFQVESLQILQRRFDPLFPTEKGWVYGSAKVPYDESQLEPPRPFNRITALVASGLRWLVWHCGRIRFGLWYLENYRANFDEANAIGILSLITLLDVVKGKKKKLCDENVRNLPIFTLSGMLYLPPTNCVGTSCNNVLHSLAARPFVHIFRFL